MRIPVHPLVRVVAGLVAGLCALLTAFLLSVPHSALIDYSFEKSLEIRSDFQTLSESTQKFDAEHGRYPNEGEFERLVENTELQHINYWIAAPDEHCDRNESELGPAALKEFKICHWRGEWTEEFVVSTGETSLPSSREDYKPSIWTIVILALITTFLAVVALKPAKLTGELAP